MTTAVRPRVDAIALLESEGFRVLRPFSGGARSYRTPDVGTLVKSAVIADTETTGLDLRRDAIVQLALQRVLYDDRGIISVGAPWVALEEPSVPIHDEAAAVHGITMAMVAGKRFDDDAVYSMLDGVALLIAHHAAFDAPIMLRRFPKLAGASWACSLDSIDWRARGYESTKLRYLLQDHASSHGKGHDAGFDVASLAHCLATPFAGGESPFVELLANAREKTARVIASDAPFHVKDALKLRDYHWNDPAKPDARFRSFKAWWIDVPLHAVEAEQDFLGTLGVLPDVKILTARTRYLVD